MDMFDFWIAVLILGMPALAILLMVCYAPWTLILIFATLAAACFIAKGEGK